jgi:hypothetical protein
VYAYLRLAQREWSQVPAPRQRLRAGLRALAYTSFNLALTLVLGLLAVVPLLAFTPYLLQWLESLWGTFRPAVKVRPTVIGMRQLIVSCLFTILFILIWRLK